MRTAFQLASCVIAKTELEIGGTQMNGFAGCLGAAEGVHTLEVIKVAPKNPSLMPSDLHVQPRSTVA